jgi:hypothetical protein
LDAIALDLLFSANNTSQSHLDPLVVAVVAVSSGGADGDAGNSIDRRRLHYFLLSLFEDGGG